MGTGASSGIASMIPVELTICGIRNGLLSLGDWIGDQRRFAGPP